MIDQELITAMINNMIRDHHVMESGRFSHSDGEYDYKIKRVKKKWVVNHLQ